VDPRLTGTEASKLPFKVRLCIEGIPHHARQEAAIRQLLPHDALLEGIDYNHRSDNKANCYCIVIWAKDPDLIVMEGSLCLEELPGRPHAAWHFVNKAAINGVRRLHTGPVHRLSYEVLIHIDQVTHYRPPSAHLVDWPEECHVLRWRLGYRDDWMHGRQHRAIHDRLGPHKRDHSPLAGGGAASNPEGFIEPRRVGTEGDRRGGPFANGLRHRPRHDNGWLGGYAFLGAMLQGPFLVDPGSQQLFFINKPTLLANPEPMPWELVWDWPNKSTFAFGNMAHHLSTTCYTSHSAMHQRPTKNHLDM
jgi:hypothetical protein